MVIKLQAQHLLHYAICSPDSNKYTIHVLPQQEGERTIKIDLGYFNYTDSPSVHFWVKPLETPFILDEAVWTIAYLKPVINRRKRVDVGNWGEVISYYYQNKYNKIFPEHFNEHLKAHSSHGLLYFDIRGTFLPKYINVLHFKSAGPIQKDSLSVFNKGLSPIECILTYSKSTQADTIDSKVKPIIVASGKKKGLLIQIEKDLLIQNEQPNIYLHLYYRRKGEQRWHFANYRSLVV
jgi:hypothetical protein